MLENFFKFLGDFKYEIQSFKIRFSESSILVCTVRPNLCMFSRIRRVIHWLGTEPWDLMFCDHDEFMILGRIGIFSKFCFDFRIKPAPVNSVFLCLTFI